MEKINLKLFSQLMALDGTYAATNVEIISGDTAYMVEKSANVSFVLSGGVPMSGEDSVTYTVYEGEIKRRVFFAVEDLVTYVKDNFAANGLITVGRIEDYDTFAQFKEAAEFKCCSMQQLLQNYADCDEFSLTGFYNGGEDEGHPYGIYKLDKNTGDNALKLIQFEQCDLCKYFYEMANEGKEDALPFDTIYADICAEVEEICSSADKKPVDISAMYSEGKLKQKGDNFEINFIYRSAAYLYRCKEDIAAQQANTLVRPVDGEFEFQPLSAVKPFINRILVTYCWHCTVSDKLGKVFFIKLNDETKAWLAQFADDYDIAKTGLFDLAFYKDGACRFSSNTSEKSHCDYPEN